PREIAGAQQHQHAIVGPLENGHLAKRSDIVHAGIRARIRRQHDSGVQQDADAIRHAATSSVHTLKLSSVDGPKLVVSATSAASRPRAISTRPMRGTLLRGSNVYQPSSRYASNQAAKSIGAYGGGTPISPR